MSCNICCEKYNKSTCKKVTCYITDCGFEACKTCVRTYLIGTTNDPHCMNCKNQWETKFLVENLNRTFMDNQYRKHRKQLLVEKEISRTPELMNLVERTKQIEDETKELNNINNELIEARKKFYELNRKHYEKRNKINRIRNGDVTIERKKFIMPCPGDDCKGFLSTQYKCEVCKLFTCPDCFEIIGYTKEDDHICTENNLKSAEMIKKETKGCPHCGVRIYKLSGCDQMWCTECRVAFSWNTGKIIITGNIHNPHYYNYMRENANGAAPRNPQDILCGGLINYYSLNSILRFLNSHNKPETYTHIKEKDSHINDFIMKYKIFKIPNFTTILSNLHRLINHITNYDLQNCRQKVRTLINHDDDTVQYILNKKSREELATTIFRNDNMRKKYNELLNIYELLSVAGIERFNIISETYRSYKFDNENLIEFIKIIIQNVDEYNNLINYCNKQLAIISYTYNLTVQQIDFKCCGEWEYKVKSYKFTHNSFKKIFVDNNSEASCSYH